MTRLLTLSCLLAALTSAYAVLAESLPQTTPSPSLHLVAEDDASNLELRQLNPGVNPVAVTQAQQQVPPVTVYEINSGIGPAAAQIEVTYTQLFSPIPDQWPSPSPGTIGYGTLQKREVPAQATVVVGTVTQTVVWIVETEVVVQPLRKATEVLVVQTMAVFREARPDNATGNARNETLLRVGNDTFPATNATRPPALLRGSGACNDTSARNNTVATFELRGSGHANMRHAHLTASG